MRELTLQQFLETGTQEQVATALGVTQGAIHQMKKSGRDVRIVLDDQDQLVRAYEIKEIGNRAA